MNADWHRQHVLPKGATTAQRIAWHRAHQRACACRPIPPKLLAEMKQSASVVDPRFAPIVAALTKLPKVTYGGKGFGSSALKFDGKLFAMIDSKGEFVAKLPRARVDELVSVGKGKRFESGKGRAMKEWLAVDKVRRSPSWLELAREAHRFVSRG
ncbi:MAG TPA: hypothetical protein VFK05_05835 [Polyangiaceae bacterium]|nr:hypothetical protein [Polyangiaceae bacterium]